MGTNQLVLLVRGDREQCVSFTSQLWWAVYISCFCFSLEAGKYLISATFFTCIGLRGSAFYELVQKEVGHCAPLWLYVAVEISYTTLLCLLNGRLCMSADLRIDWFLFINFTLCWFILISVHVKIKACALTVLYNNLPLLPGIMYRRTWNCKSWLLKGDLSNF